MIAESITPWLENQEAFQIRLIEEVRLNQHDRAWRHAAALREYQKIITKPVMDQLAVLRVDAV